jgi:hypothetical protein
MLVLKLKIDPNPNSQQMDDCVRIQQVHILPTLIQERIGSKMNNNQDDDDDDSHFNLRREIRLLLIQNPQMSVDIIADRIEKTAGTKPSKITVSAVKSEFRQIIRLLVDHHLLPQSFLEDGLVPKSTTASNIESVTVTDPATSAKNGNAVAGNGNAKGNAGARKGNACVCIVCQRHYRSSRSHSVFCSQACKMRHQRMKKR